MRGACAWALPMACLHFLLPIFPMFVGSSGSSSDSNSTLSCKLEITVGSTCLDTNPYSHDWAGSAQTCGQMCCEDTKCAQATYYTSGWKFGQCVRSATTSASTSEDGAVCAVKPTGPLPPGPAPPQAVWPEFASKSALMNDAWGDYMKLVYGEIPETGYPIKIRSNWVLYDQALVQANVKNYPSPVGICPNVNPGEGEHYTMNNMYAPAFLSWIWHPYPYAKIAANTWVEVLHEADPFGDEHYGAWFVYAPGSGVYFDVGNTISFPEHEDAYLHFGVRGGNWNEELSKAAAAKGYDSIQFLAHVDHVNYQCDTKNTGKSGLEYMGLEVLGVKLTGTYACADQAGAPSTIKAGWMASKTCVCDTTMQYLNCKGVPVMTSRVMHSSASSNFSNTLVLV